MKRLSVFLLLFVFLFALVGCGKNKENNNIVTNAMPPNVTDVPKIKFIEMMEFDSYFICFSKEEGMEKYVDDVEKAIEMNMTYLEYLEYLGVNIPKNIRKKYSDENYMAEYNYCKEQLNKNKIK